MKKFLALIIAVVITTTTLTGCNSSKVTMNKFDFGGIVIDIPDSFQIESSNYSEIMDRNTVRFSNDDNIIVIMYMMGEWEPDDSLTQNSDIEIISEKKSTMGNNATRYLHSKMDYEGKKFYQQTFSLFLEDRWVIIQCNSYDNDTDKLITKVIRGG